MQCICPPDGRMSARSADDVAHFNLHDFFSCKGAVAREERLRPPCSDTFPGSRQTLSRAAQPTSVKDLAMDTIASRLHRSAHRPAASRRVQGWLNLSFRVLFCLLFFQRPAAFHAPGRSRQPGGRHPLASDLVINADHQRVSGETITLGIRWSIRSNSVF